MFDLRYEKLFVQTQSAPSNRFIAGALLLLVCALLPGITVRAQTPAASSKQPQDKITSQDKQDRATQDAPRVDEQIIVSATRTETRLSQTSASVVVLGADELEASAAVTLDDKLRQVPGFSLFRRAGSRAANPTTQGVSLRGVGASGASRASVLFDGVPLNDAFGGWVYWGRVPRTEVKRIEILRGGASDLYGGAALSGVIALEPKRVQAKNKFVYDFETSIGNQTTPEASVWLGTSFGKWRVSASGEAFRTNGFINIDARERGLIDTPVNVKRASGNLTLERDEIVLPFGNKPYGGRIFARGSYYTEARGNGTRLQTNDTQTRGGSFGFDFNLPVIGNTHARAYATTQNYHQIFSAIAVNRASETLTRRQIVPSQILGVSLQSSRAVGARTSLVAGIDARNIRGTSDETIFVNSQASSVVTAGGREQSVGLFAASVVRIGSRALLNVGGRFDRWRNYAASAQSRG